MKSRLTLFAIFSLASPFLCATSSAQRAPVAPMPVAAPARPAAPPIMVAPARAVAPLHAPAAPHAPAHPVAPGIHPVAPAHNPPHPVGPQQVTHSHPVRTNHPSTIPPITSSAPIFPDDGFGYPVPGLGFDYVHFAATHPNAGRHHFQGGVMPFVGGGIYVPFPMYAESSYPTEVAAPVQSEEPESPGEAMELQERAPVAQPSVPARSHVNSSSAPLPSSEYIFVRRDGTVFFAVAYSWLKGSLEYITQDGLRRMVPLDSLDLDATAQFNEQRGVSFRLPA